jgi:hypothetical protein
MSSNYHKVENEFIVETPTGIIFSANAGQVYIKAGVGLSANGSVGTNGQILTSNGTSIYWATSSGGGGGYFKGNDGSVNPTSGNNFFRINANTQSNNITIAAGENAQVTGPFAIQTGSTLTVSTGGRVVII